MKTFQLNPAVKEFDVTIVLSANTLSQKAGFDFDNSDDELEDYAAILKISGERDENGFPYTTVELNKWEDQHNRISRSDSEWTGDDNGTISDIIKLLNEGVISIEEIEYNDNDMSVDENDTYVHSFVEVIEQEKTPA